MKKKDVPQDSSDLEKFTKELYYAVDENGNYTTALSKGWEVKSNALNVAWDDIKERVQAAYESVQKGEASPILFFMELHIMDIGLLSAYTGFWKWQVSRHLKSTVFKKLSDKKLKEYADVFNVSIEQLKTMTPNED